MVFWGRGLPCPPFRLAHMNSYSCPAPLAALPAGAVPAAGRVLRLLSCPGTPHPGRRCGPSPGSAGLLRRARPPSCGLPPLRGGSLRTQKKNRRNLGNCICYFKQAPLCLLVTPLPYPHQGSVRTGILMLLNSVGMALRVLEKYLTVTAVSVRLRCPSEVLCSLKDLSQACEDS